MAESLKISRGRLIARALAGSWRTRVAPPKLSAAELAAITPVLIQAGGGALVWRRICDSALAESDTAAQLQQMYRLHRLEASVHVQRIKRVLGQFRRAGIEPVLVKGWNVARLYPEPGVRHYFDVDLCVPHEAYAESLKLVAAMEEDSPYIDLHDGFTKLDGGARPQRSRAFRVPTLVGSLFGSKGPPEVGTLNATLWDEFFARTQMVSLCSPRPVGESPANKIHHEGTEDTEKIRVPCAEDHLRILCIHWLRHGAWKPAGLCDIAVELESRPADFDWQRCLGPDPVRAGWVACTIGLARELLDAGSNLECGDLSPLLKSFQSGDKSPHSKKVRPLPAWLVPAVLRQWSRSLSPNYREQALPSLLNQVTCWKALANEIYSRLDQPVRATVALHGRFNNWPRLPYQLGELLLHSSEVPKQLSLMVRERRSVRQAASNQFARETGS